MYIFMKSHTQKSLNLNSHVPTDNLRASKNNASQSNYLWNSQRERERESVCVCVNIRYTTKDYIASSLSYSIS